MERKPQLSGPGLLHGSRQPRSSRAVKTLAKTAADRQHCTTQIGSGRWFSTLGSSHSSGVHVKFMGRIFQQTKMQMVNSLVWEFGRPNTYINGGTSTKTYQNATKPWCPASRRENVKAMWISGHRSANRIVRKQLEQWMPCENPWKNTQKRIMNTRFYSKTVPVKNSTWTCHMPEVQPSKWLATMYHHILQISGL